MGASIPSIALLTCMWQRPELTRLVFNNYASIQNRLRGILDLHLIAVGSEGTASRDLAEERGFTYVEYANSPLGAKWNGGMDAVRASGADAMIVVGSDDLLNTELFAVYARLLADGYVFAGLCDTYFWDLSTRHLALWRGYSGGRKGEPMGLGRLIHRDLLDKMDWQPWDGTLEKALDFSMMLKLEPFLCDPGLSGRMAVLSCLEGDFAPVDVKGGENMWGFEHVVMSCQSFDLMDDMAVLGRYYEPEILAGFLRMSGVRRPVLPSRRMYAPADRVSIEAPAAGGKPLHGLKALVVTASVPHELVSPAAMRSVGLAALTAAAGAETSLISLHPAAASDASLPLHIEGVDLYVTLDSHALASRIKAQAPDILIASGALDPAQVISLLVGVETERAVRPLRLIWDTPDLTDGRDAVLFEQFVGHCDAILLQNHETLAATPPERPCPTLFAPPFFLGTPCDASFPARRNICFAGDIQHSALQSRMRLFVRNALPLIREALPGTLFSIFSYLPMANLQKLAGDGVLLVSDLRDITRVMSLHTLFLSFESTFSGSCFGFQGLALACGMPVVTGSTVNAFQNDGQPLAFLQSSPAEMAQTCIRLLSDHALWQESSEKARRLVDNAGNCDRVIEAFSGLRTQWNL